MTQTKNAAVRAADAIIMPPGSDLTEAEAFDLDLEIDAHLGACEQLLHAYLDTGQRLARMQDSKGYAALGFRSWGTYLDSKERYGRTFLSYLLKLGRAGDARSVIELGMQPAVLIHYISKVGYPEKVHDLIRATWPDVKDLSPKDAGARIKQFVDAHDVQFKKPRKARENAVPPATSPERAPEPEQTLALASIDLTNYLQEDEPADWEVHFQKLYDPMALSDRAQFVRAMERFLERYN